MLTIFVTRYWELFFLRLLTGISIGGSLPLIFSLLSDMYEHRHRAFVSAIVQVAVGAGIAVGQGVAGYVGRFPIGRITCVGMYDNHTGTGHRAYTFLLIV